MPWYVLRTQVGKEDKAFLLFNYLFSDVKIVLPKRKLSWRKKGRLFEVIKPLFSGYLFVYADDIRVNQICSWLRMHQIGVWFVRFGGVVIPVEYEETLVIKKLLNNGEIIGPSIIMQDCEKIKIVGGPLVGFEGLVERYCKRDRRVIVRVTLENEKKLVELEGKWVKSVDYFRLLAKR